jgi:hypothetical protein
MQRVILVTLTAAALAACSDTIAERDQGVGASPPAASRSDPMSNAGQSTSPTTGSASNAASGSRATPSPR